MSKTPPTLSQRLKIYANATEAGESEQVARALARETKPIEFKQLTRYIELIEKGTNRQVAAEVVNLRPYQLAALLKRHPDFAEAVREAYNRHIEKLVDELPTIGEGAETPVELGLARLKSDNYKWLASKAMPKMYGDKMAVEVEHRINLSGVLLEAQSRIIPVVGSVVEEIDTALISDNVTDGDVISTNTDADAYNEPLPHPEIDDEAGAVEADMFS